jgi:hypothetical protein
VPHCEQRNRSVVMPVSAPPACRRSPRRALVLGMCDSVPLLAPGMPEKKPRDGRPGAELRRGN